MNNKSKDSTIPDRLSFIREHYTDAFIPDDIKYLNKVLGTNKETLNNYMYRFSLHGDYKKKKKRLYEIIYYLRQNHFTLDELSEMFDLEKKYLTVYLCSIKKERGRNNA